MKTATVEDAREVLKRVGAIDAHTESFIFTRLARYDMTKRHKRGLFGGKFYSQFDIERAIEVGMTGLVASICTNPFRPRRFRTSTLLKNLKHLKEHLERHPRCEVVTTHGEFMRAQGLGQFPVWLGIQGGNALDTHPGDLQKVPDGLITRITLMHATKSTIAAPALPTGREGTIGLTEFGRDYIRVMNEQRVLVDLAHMGDRGFWEALEVHDRSQPAIISHTGANGQYPLWRNNTDAQFRAIAELGGVNGIIFHGGYLTGQAIGASCTCILDHMQYVMDLVGEDYVCMGSDWDGGIIPPKDFRTVSELPVLVAGMLNRGWTEERVQKVLTGNYLRVMALIRP